LAAAEKTHVTEPVRRSARAILAALRAAGGPPRERWETTLLMAVGVACGFASSAAFFLHVFGWVRMPFFVNFFGMPVIVLMMVGGLYSWQRRLPFWRRLRAGLLAGALGLVAYDLIRYLVYRSEILAYDPFHAVPRLGALITGQPAAALSSIYAGWTYHFWNGFSFAVIYALVVGPRHWAWGVLWAMLLEIGMLLSYPTFLDVRLAAPFIGVSWIGHMAYGTVLGLTVRRAAGEERGR
jgi:hypothetical protein